MHDRQMLPGPQPDIRSRIYDETIFTPHTATNVSIVNDANSNALSTEANFITPPLLPTPPRR